MTDNPTRLPKITSWRASGAKRRYETDIEVANVAVRSSDRGAFLGIINAREALISAPRKLSAKPAIAAAEIASFALAAKEAVANDSPPELVTSQLETAAARAIDLIVRLKVKN